MPTFSSTSIVKAEIISKAEEARLIAEKAMKDYEEAKRRMEEAARLSEEMKKKDESSESLLSMLERTRKLLDAARKERDEALSSRETMSERLRDVVMDRANIIRQRNIAKAESGRLSMQLFRQSTKSEKLQSRFAHTNHRWCEFVMENFMD